MNIAQLAAEKQNDDTPVELIIRDRNSEPYTGKSGEPVKWFVVGEYAKVVRDFEREATDRVLRAARKGEDFTADESTQHTLEKLGSAVVRWENMEDEKGQAIPCNPRNVAAVLKAGEWIVPQLTRVHRAHASFFGASSSASAGS